MTSETQFDREVEEKIANAMIEAGAGVYCNALTAENGEPVLQSI